MNHLNRFAVLLIACLWWGFSHAQTAAVSDFSRFMGVLTGNTATVSLSSTGVPLATAAQSALPTGSGWTQAGNFGVAKAPTVAGGLNVASRVTIPIAAGRSAVINAASAVTAANLFKAFRLTSPLGLTLAATPYLIDWMTQAGVSPNPSSTDPSKPFTASGYRYSVATNNCQSYSLNTAFVQCFEPGAKYCGINSETSTMVYIWKQTASTAASYPNCEFSSVLGVYKTAVTGLPSSMDDIAPYMQAKQPDPRALAELNKLGIPVDMDRPTVSGPSSVAGPTEKTTNPDGSTVEKTCNYDLAYATDTMSAKQTCTSVSKNPSGTVTGTETKTSEQQLEGVPLDTPLGAIPQLYTQKYPDGPGGVWTARKAQLLSTPIGSLSTNLMPNIAGAGECPAWMLNLDLGVSVWQFGTHNVAPECWVWDFGKVVIIISALLLARRLIFGG